MPVYPGAEWRGPIATQFPNGMVRHMGIVAHVMQGTLLGSDSWFKNPKSGAGATWGIGKTGRVFQWADTSTKVWAQGAGNGSWLSIEFEGYSGDSLTQRQIEEAAKLYAWAVQIHGIPVQLSERPAVPGFCWHGAGGAAWGGHTDCPGQLIRDDRGHILSIAHTLLQPEEKVRPMYTPALALEPIVAELPCPTGGVWLLAASGAVYAFGGAPFRGGANGKDYFRGRKAARLQLHADGLYEIVATSDEKYAPRD